MDYPDHKGEDEKLEKIASRMKLLAEPMRLRLLTILRGSECCVKDLVNQTGAGQANISKHLALLKTEGVVSRRKEGLYVYYFISDPSIFEIYDCVNTSLTGR